MRAIALAIIMLAVSLKTTIFQAFVNKGHPSYEQRKWGPLENAITTSLLVGFLICLIMGW